MTIYHTRVQRRTRSRTRAIGLTLLAIVCGSVLTGCLAPTPNAASGYPIFDRDQTTEDELPDYFDAIDLSQYDLSTTRYSGSLDDVDYFLLRTNDSNETYGFCLAIASADNPMVGCAGVGGGTLGGQGLDNAEFMPEPVTADDGWVTVSENVRVRE